MRTLERAATTLGIQVARSIHSRWRRTPARRAQLERLVANVERQPVAPAAVDPDVGAIEVRDLRAELTRELDRLARADIGASRGSGKLAGERPSSGGRPPPPR